MDLSFPKDRVRALLAHSRAASERHPTFDQLYDPSLHKPGREDAPAGADEIDPARVPAGLLLVGDSGVYLMSNVDGGPSDPDRPGPVYATEADPTTLDFDSWRKHKQATFGGDDGVEFLDADTVDAWLAGTPGPIARVRMTPTQMAFYTVAKRD